MTEMASDRDDKNPEDNPEDNLVVDHGDRWIYGVWIVIALIAVAILPFASRMGDVARAIASFCGITIT